MKPLVVAIVGPTAAGKTSAAMRLCDDLPFEIVSADSMLVYRKMDIGTAKPTQEELEKYPHHCINLVDPDEDFTAGDFVREALAAMERVYEKGLFPLIVGGSGFYVKALGQGMYPVPDIPDTIRQELHQQKKEEGLGPLYGELQRMDPESADKIHPNDGYRILRALEVFRATGKTLSSFREIPEENKPPFDLFRICLNCERKKIHENIETRTDQMLEGGFVEEVRELLKDYSPDLKSMQSVGYMQMCEHLNGELTLDEARQSMNSETKRLAKQQLTWFRKDTDLHWLEPRDRDGILKLVSSVMFRVEDGRGLYA